LGPPRVPSYVRLAIDPENQAHVTISVLALLLERIAELRDGDTWRKLVLDKETVARLSQGEHEIGRSTASESTLSGGRSIPTAPGARTDGVGFGGSRMQ
jgi:hypothetical protein